MIFSRFSPKIFIDLAFLSAADLFDVLKELATETGFFSLKYSRVVFHPDF